MADTIPVTTNNAKSIKVFFELSGGCKVEMAEMKALSADERAELGRLAQAELIKLGL